MEILLIDKTRSFNDEEAFAAEKVIRVPEGSTIKSLKEIAGFKNPTFFIINGKMQDMTWQLKDGDKVVARLVVSGG